MKPKIVLVCPKCKRRKEIYVSEAEGWCTRYTCRVKMKRVAA